MEQDDCPDLDKLRDFLWRQSTLRTANVGSIQADTRRGDEIMDHALIREDASPYLEDTEDASREAGVNRKSMVDPRRGFPVVYDIDASGCVCYRLLKTFASSPLLLARGDRSLAVFDHDKPARSSPWKCVQNIWWSPIEIVDSAE